MKIIKLATQLQTSLAKVQGRLEALAACILRMELESHSSGPRPSMNPPEKYDRVSKSLVDQFISQVKAMAEFEAFHDKRQKILWAQLYLTGSALAWSHIITMGSNDLAANPWHFGWAVWLGNFRAAFSLRDLAQDALTQIGSLQQGSKTITEYCTAFFELKSKLGPADTNSKYVKDCFWKVSSVAAMEALMNTDFATAEEAWNILLCHDSKLADIAVRWKGQWHSVGAPKLSSLAPALAALSAVHVATLPGLKDPDAMDVDRMQCGAARKCFKCSKAGHLIVECLA
ncbi:hypothetical protein C0993_008502 [Termitomyces sp. T159_Od127]|nr:hypothetical protein C0993_008502 [Termitomyces sp. T159_Od127]